MLRILLFIVSFTLIGATFGDFNISQKTLDNGMQIIVKTDNRAPIFISQIWVKVGSSDEPSSISGVSHLLEHLMFKATKSYKSGEFSKQVAKNGGSENAFTSRDYTAYYQKMHISKLELAIKLEAARLQDLVFDDSEFEKERQVVIEERRLRLDDKPNAQVRARLFELAFGKNSPYSVPIIGLKKDLETMTLDDVKTWYKRYYVPNNVALVVVGDVEPDEVFRLAENYFGDKTANFTIAENRKKTTKFNTQSASLSLPAKLPFFMQSLHVPSLKTTDKKTAYSLEMLAYVLDDILTKTLIRQQQSAISISTYYNLYSKYDGLWTISFVPDNDILAADLEAEIIKIAAKIINNPDQFAADLERIKTQIEAGFIYQQDSISTQSYYLGSLWAAGIGVDATKNYVENMRKINLIDVANVAKKYLNFDIANRVQLIPQ